MSKMIFVLLGVTLLASDSTAGTSCTTRKSGSVVIETCSNTRERSYVQCRSYWSGNVKKTHCSS